MASTQSYNIRNRCLFSLGRGEEESLATPDLTLTLKKGFHLVLSKILVGIAEDGGRIISFLSSPTPNRTSRKKRLMVSVDLLKVRAITLKRWL